MSAWKGFVPRRGFLGLVGLRWGLIVLTSLPGAMVAARSLSAGPARSPWFTDAPTPLPVAQQYAMFSEISGASWWLWLVGASFTFFLGQIVTAGALQVLGPSDETDDVGVWRAVFHDGLRRIWPLLRIVGLALFFQLFGLALIRLGFSALGKWGNQEQWSLYSQGIVLPLAQLGCWLVWATMVGACAHWCRVVLVADDRRRVRRVVPMVLTVLLKRPLGTWVFHGLLHVTSLGLGVAVLVGWRQSASGQLWWAVGSLLGLLLQAYVWVALQHSGRWVYSEARWDQLRQTPDEPFGWWGRLRARLRRAPDAGEGA